MMPDAFSPTYVTYLLSWTVSFLSLHGTQGFTCFSSDGQACGKFWRGRFERFFFTCCDFLLCVAFEMGLAGCFYWFCCCSFVPRFLVGS
ncbi:hypothetical protein DL95DRAFT_124676 [Leptodontidium sp. 2 PMI_412]|nr:hypothetical protein DL95DRAFT_124676 [Leptodontidium sp. 2 PMI_412]